jgi:hypothetical protein
MTDHASRSAQTAGINQQNDDDRPFAHAASTAQRGSALSRSTLDGFQ